MNKEDTMIAELRRLIDLTKLDISTTPEEAQDLADRVVDQNLHSACIRPSHVKKLMDLHKPYRLSAVLGFPKVKFEISSDEYLKQAKDMIGRGPKIIEAAKALEDGALELDPVMNIGNLTALQKELQQLVQKLFEFAQSRPNERFWMKPIFSCELLNDEEIETTVKIFADVVNRFYEQNPDAKSQIKFAYKNSTGYVVSQKNKEGVDYQLRTTSPKLISMIAGLLDKYDPDRNIYIKAAGGIRDVDTALAIRQAANGRLSHIGTSKNFTETTVTDSY